MPIPVSIIVPAYNAANTLTETVQSVLTQAHQNWEVILVENGSTDSTVAVTEALAARDPRIRAVRNPVKGVSAARNHGLKLALHDWVLFLDADDWIMPGHLSALLRMLAADPTLDAVHCGWRRVTPEGVIMFEQSGPEKRDLFPILARTCPFAIHACIVRRSLIMEVGGFDMSLRTCEDWDLWQRIARSGARFAVLPEILACYRARPNSASMNGQQMAADSFKVIERGFGPDERVPRPLPCYAGGLPSSSMPSVRLSNLIWQGGLILGADVEAVMLFEKIPDDPLVDVDAEGAATSLFEAMLLPTASPPNGSLQLYRKIEPQLQRFLHALEIHTGQKGLARSIQVHLERRAVKSVSLSRPVTAGRTHAITVEITKPFCDIVLPPGIERLYCRVELESENIGNLELPVFEGLVSAGIIADAVATEFAWPILGRFFRTEVYPRLKVDQEADGWKVRQGRNVLARALPGEKQISWDEAHDQIGWPIFLQEAWGLKRAPTGHFHNMQPAERRLESGPATELDAEWLIIDLADPLPDRRPVSSQVDLILTVAGIPIARTPLNVPGLTLRASTTRAALTCESGFELCRICVREGLLQRPLKGEGSLRKRLTKTRADHSGAELENSVSHESEVAWRTKIFLPFAARKHPGIIRRLHDPAAPSGNGASRRAAQLPEGVVAGVNHVAQAGRENVLVSVEPNGSTATLLCAPELERPKALARATVGLAQPEPREGVCDHQYFEQLFASGADPWDYGSAYEQTKYQQTLDLLPPVRFRRGLELACAEGHFTVQLAPRVQRLLATDISSIALERTRRRCAKWPNVEYQQLDFIHNPLPVDQFDLIVCSEVLYFTESRDALKRVLRNITAALVPGGYLVCAHAHVHIDDPQQPGFGWDSPFGAKTISDVLQSLPDLGLVSELRTPLYRIQLYQRSRLWHRWLHRTTPHLISIAQPTALPDHVAKQVHWGSLDSDPVPEDPRHTSRLPILMYHRIAAEGPATLARYRTTPATFEAQLKYLRDEGFQSVTLNEWRSAREAKRPLRGNRVLLSFDDGCVDFLQSAWPLLGRYGFNALVFLPTAEIAGNCRWDARHGEPAPIMTWDDIRALRKAGVEFGSHTATHPLLTGLSPEEIAREALQSRAAFEEQLGENVTSIAYPFGATDQVVESVFRACGYQFGLTCQNRRCTLTDPLLSLPRIEVPGNLESAAFVGLLS